MTIDERNAINARIDAMIGGWDKFEESVKDASLSEKIDARAKYRSLREKLLKIAEKGGEKALAMTLIEDGRTSTGLTANGKHFVWTANNGYTARSRYCGSLYIEDVGMVYTSGTVAKAFEYIINN